LAVPNNLETVLAHNNGTFIAAQANAAGVSNERLRLLMKAGELEKVSFGVYIAPEAFEDKLYTTQLRRKKIIYSHETALYLHDLSDRDSIKYTVTVPTGYNTTRLREDGFRVFYIKRELHNIGAVRILTMFGNYVTVYNMERTICDCMRSRNQIDIAIITDALKRYVRKKDKNINSLMRLAEVFQVTKPLRTYMEVLL